MHRWYDPETGRWISEDPIGFAAGDANLYRYVGNGVTGATDPSGLEIVAGSVTYSEIISDDWYLQTEKGRVGYRGVWHGQGIKEQLISRDDTRYGAVVSLASNASHNNSDEFFFTDTTYKPSVKTLNMEVVDWTAFEGRIRNGESLSKSTIIHGAQEGDKFCTTVRGVAIKLKKKPKIEVLATAIEIGLPTPVSPLLGIASDGSFSIGVSILGTDVAQIMHGHSDKWESWANGGEYDVLMVVAVAANGSRLSEGEWKSTNPSGTRTLNEYPWDVHTNYRQRKVTKRTTNASFSSQ